MFDGVTGKMAGKIGVVRHAVHLPDYIVSSQQPLKEIIEVSDAAADIIFCQNVACLQLITSLFPYPGIINLAFVPDIFFAFTTGIGTQGRVCDSSFYLVLRL